MAAKQKRKKGLMQQLVTGKTRVQPDQEDFFIILNEIDIEDADFNIETFPPGSSGEGRLYRSLVGGHIVDN